MHIALHARLKRLLPLVLFGADFALGGVFSVWRDDFALQPPAARPALEVRYTDSRRVAFEIIAATYHFIGTLNKPHTLCDAQTGSPRLTISFHAMDGRAYSTRTANGASRINLTRRGPYYCEVHWLDITLADSEGQMAPFKGDLALYCYPGKILATLTVHSTGDFAAGRWRIEGLKSCEFAAAAAQAGTVQHFDFPVFGETAPLPALALLTETAEVPLQYDHRRGCYTIGSQNPGGFQAHFYEHPNHYETVRFRVLNDTQPRTIYICHETTSGSRGTVEGGVLLDAQGHPLPITVQISKNFAGEKEEEFYNPDDTAFSETWFPLILAPRETCTVSSLHLYQNWGRHMVKQFSSLGAWMDYFHSSTGVTETTCYVPFKFAGPSGVDIADFRAMSQSSFWQNQPQHDNVAGHSFLSYYDGRDWQFLTYQGTQYYSTGPNWMDIELDYLSSDGKIKTSVRTYELPQKDELRNFVQVKIKALQPLHIENARENFRLLTSASWVQKLRYSHFALSGQPDRALSFATDHFAVRGEPLGRPPSFCALFGDPKGSNAFVLFDWQSPWAPAASVCCGRNGDSRMLLVPDTDVLDLNPGDVIEFGAIVLPYGEVEGAKTPGRECRFYGTDAPKIVQMIAGRKISDWPTTVKAQNDRAEFILQGGRDLVPVIITGLSDFRWPALYRFEAEAWHLIRQDRLNQQDGGQTFCDSDGHFGAVFLLDADQQPQRLKIMCGSRPAMQAKIQLTPIIGTAYPCASLKAAWMKKAIQMEFRQLLMPGDAAFHTDWRTGTANDLWFQKQDSSSLFGVRLSPNEHDVDLEIWMETRDGWGTDSVTRLEIALQKTIFENANLRRLWTLNEGEWHVSKDPDLRQAGAAFAIQSRDQQSVCAIFWSRRVSVAGSSDGDSIHQYLHWPPCPDGRRLYTRGKLYLFRGNLAELKARVRREQTE